MVKSSKRRRRGGGYKKRLTEILERLEYKKIKLQNRVWLESIEKSES